MLEEHEEVVENWYFHHQDKRLERFFCEAHVLKDSDQGINTLQPCLDLVLISQEWLPILKMCAFVPHHWATTALFQF